MLSEVWPGMKWAILVSILTKIKIIVALLESSKSVIKSSKTAPQNL